MGIIKKLWIILVLPCLLLTACGSREQQREGDCVLEVSMEALPEAWNLLDDNIKEQFYIQVTVQNITSEKRSRIVLKSDNQFRETSYLRPGIYKVESCYASPGLLVDLKLETDTGQVELTRENTAVVRVLPVDSAAFEEQVRSVQASVEILELGRFSRTVQLMGDMADLENILQSMEFTPEESIYDDSVRAYDTLVVRNNEAGVAVTLQNQSAEPRHWKDCQVTGVVFSKNNVVLGGGVRLGMSVKGVCHKLEGLYGTPDAFTGTVLWGTGYGRTSAVYKDPVSGDRITLEYTPENDYLMKIEYQFARFED